GRGEDLIPKHLRVLCVLLLNAFSSASIIPAPVNLVHIHTPTWPVIVSRKTERSHRTIVSQCLRTVRFVWIVDRKLDRVFHGLCCEHQQRVIDAQLREADDMDYGRPILFDVEEQLLRRVFLVRAIEWKDHAPMAALKITLPRTTAFVFEQPLVRRAELP